MVPHQSSVDPAPGHGLLSILSNQNIQNSIDFNAGQDSRNARTNDMQVEVNYAQDFLGIGRNIYDPGIESMARKRLEARKK